MDSITVSSSFLIPSARNAEITPAMLNVIWFLADRLDGMRLDKIPESGVLVRVPSKRLRNPDGRSDNVWLRDTLDRMLGIQLHGEHAKGEWGAVLLAQWEFKEGGTVTEMIVPPAAIHALKAPRTFAKIEVMAAYKLGGHARRLYAALADKKNMRQKWWEFSTDELRLLFGISSKYPKWYDFRRYVLDPALDEINDFGTVKVTMKPAKEGRSIVGARFDWDWKDPHDASDTDAENSRHSSARRKAEETRDMPPLSDDEEPAAVISEPFDETDFRLWRNKNPGGRKREYLQDRENGVLYWRTTEEDRAQIAEQIMREAGFRK